MVQIDKIEFGNFIAKLRKEKNLTQKDIAERLYVSVQAVSKWERGLSFPDITLLIPLAEILGINVSELLKGRKSLETESYKEEVEDLVKRVVELSQESPEEKREKKKKNIFIFLLALVFMAIEYFVLIKYMNLKIENVLTELLLGILFGAGAWIFMDEQLPKYYDENKISFYSNGFFRLNLVGLYFNNSNWKHILNYLRYWTLGLAFFAPFIYLLPISSREEINLVTRMILLFGSLFFPLYIIGKKYE